MQICQQGAHTYVHMHTCVCVCVHNIFPLWLYTGTNSSKLEIREGNQIRGLFLNLKLPCPIVVP